MHRLVSRNGEWTLPIHDIDHIVLVVVGSPAILAQAKRLAAF